LKVDDDSDEEEEGNIESTIAIDMMERIGNLFILLFRICCMLSIARVN
jgi:hypothetical protein